MLLYSCKTENKNQETENNSFAIDFERIEVKISKGRQTLNPNNFDPDLCFKSYEQNAKENVELLFSWQDSILANGFQKNIYESIPPGYKDTVVADLYCSSLMNPFVHQLIDSILIVYPKDHNFKDQLSAPMNSLKHHFPEIEIPKIRTMIWGYDQNRSWAEQYKTDHIYFTDNFCGISLEYFCGEKFPFLHPNIPAYFRKRLEPKYFEIHIINEFINQIVPPLDEQKQPTLLDRIIYEGIKLHILDQILPEVAVWDKIFYQEAHYQTVVEQQKEIYHKIIPLLYSSNPVEIMWTLRDGPFTNRFGKEIPPRLGEFIGWQIVKVYAEQHTEISLEQLSKKTNYKEIFNESGYKP